MALGFRLQRRYTFLPFAQTPPNPHHTLPLILYGTAICVVQEVKFLGLIFDSIPQQTIVFTALHEMQTRYSDENSVRPSVCPSVTRVIPDKTVERSVQIFIPYERTFILVI